MIGVASSVKNYGICYKTLIFPELKPQKPKIIWGAISAKLWFPCFMETTGYLDNPLVEALRDTTEYSIETLLEILKIAIIRSK